MNLLPGCRFTVAPRFHLSVDWSRRFLVGIGVEETDGFFPRGPWRPLANDELTKLIGTANSTSAGESDSFELFKLPEHLRVEWWRMLEHAADAAEGRLPGYDAFVARVVEFLTFKRLPVSNGAGCDVVVSRPGQRSVRCDPETGRPLGMTCSLHPRTVWPVPEGARAPRLWGGINLGDEATSVVLINVPCRRMNAELHCLPNQLPAVTIGELIERFLRACPDYPPVRLTLEPGEGYHLPEDGLIVDRSTEGKQEPDVMLLITEAGDRGSCVWPSAPETEELRRVGEGIWLTGRVLSPDVCSALVAAAEAEGFRPAHLKAGGRHNSEILARIPDLSEAIRVRLQERVRAAGVDFEVVAVSPDFEFYRYQEGDFVTAHLDGAVEVSPDRQSDLSLVLYLNEHFQGGETNFPDQSLNLRPVVGEGVLFRHALLHGGTSVRQGRKYIVRTSVAVSQTLPRESHTAPGFDTRSG